MTFFGWFEYTDFGVYFLMQVEIKNDFNEFEVGKFIHVLPFGNVGEINFKRQLDGSADDLVQFGRISKKIGGLLLVGGISDNCSTKKSSVFVFDGGKLNGICDMNCFDERFSSSAGYKIIEFSMLKIGILVDKDLFSPSAVSSLCDCGCSAIINLYSGFSAKKARVAAEFYSYVYGVDIAVVAENESFAYSACGDEIIWINGGDLPCKRLYSEIKVKRKGRFGF